MAILRQLQLLGLNKNEAEIYLALLKIGPASVVNLAAATAITRTSLYYQLTGLKQKGLAYESRQNKKRFFHARQPDFLKKISRHKLVAAQQTETITASLIPSLKKMVSLPSSRTRVTFYEGKQSVWEVFEIILRANKDACWFGFGEKFFEFFGYDHFIRNFSKKRRQYGRTKTLNILPFIPQAVKIAARGETYFYEFRFLKDQSDFESGICIFGDKIAIFSYAKDISATVLEGAALAALTRTMFMLIWHSLRPE